MAYGFVYVLGHEYMPELFKIGMTDRSPLQRRDELSSGTAIPCPFDLLFYIEVDGAKDVERHIHGELEGWRISDNREFFNAPIKEIFDQLNAYKLEADSPLAITSKGDELLAIAEFVNSSKPSGGSKEEGDLPCNSQS